MIYNVIFFLSFKPCCLNLDPVQHPINVKSLQYSEVQKAKKSKMLVFRPDKRVKISLKAGINHSTLSRLTSDIKDDVDNDDFKDALSVIETADYVSLLGYNFRVKFYLNSKWSLIFDDQTIGKGTDYPHLTTIGITYRPKIVKKRKWSSIYTA